MASGDAVVGSSGRQELVFPYGINSAEVRPVVGGTGAITTKNGLVTCTCGTYPGSLGGFQGKYPIFLSNSGVEVRFTAKFDSQPQANTLQVVGLGDNESGIMVGYNGTQFGFGVSFAGSMQYYFVNLTQGAALAGNLGITLNGTQYNVAVAAGDSIAALQQKIVNSQALAAGGYLVFACNSGVYITTLDAYPSAGTPSFSSGTTGVQGGISLTIEGAVPDTTWAFQADWNSTQIPQLNSIYWSEGNIFMIKVTPLGFGTIDIHVMDPVSSKMIMLHSFSRRNTSKAFYVAAGLWPAIYCRNMGSSTSVSVSTTGFNAKCTNYIQSLIARPASAVSASQWNINVTTGNTNVMTLLSELVFKGVRNRKTVMGRSIFVTARSTAPCAISLIRNGTFSVPIQTTQVNDDSCVYVDRNSAIIVSGGLMERQWYVTDTPTSLVFDLDTITMPPLSTLSLCVSSATTGNTNTLSIGCEITFVEQ
jgi:hypothetical protein